MHPDELALLIQSKLKDIEAITGPIDALLEVHRLLNTAARRSAAGETLTTAGLAALGISATVATPAANGPGGPGTDKNA